MKRRNLHWAESLLTPEMPYTAVGKIFWKLLF